MTLDTSKLQLGAHYRVQFIDSDGDLSEGVGRYIGNGIASPFIIKPNFQWDLLSRNSIEALHPDKIVALWRTDASVRKPQGLPVEELVYRREGEGKDALVTWHRGPDGELTDEPVPGGATMTIISTED